MSVLPMSKIGIMGLKRDRKDILEYIQQLGIVEIRNVDYNAGLKSVDTVAARTEFQRVKEDLLQALEIIKSYADEEKSVFSVFQGKRLFSDAEYEALIARREQIIDKAQDILKLKKQIDDKKMQISKIEGEIEDLKPWQDLTVAMSLKETKKTKVLFGIFPKRYTKEEISLELDSLGKNFEAEAFAHDVYFDIIKTTKAKTYIAAICKKEQMEKFGQILRCMDFAESQIQCDEAPISAVDRFKKELQKARDELYSCEEKICKAVTTGDDIRFLTDYYTMRIEKYKVIEQLGESQKTFVLSGFVPARMVEKLEQALRTRWNIAFAHTMCCDKDNPPILLENNRISQPLEGILETFSLPGKGELDPTMVMSIFYYFLFGIMLSDAGYGLLMIIFCSTILWRFPKMDAAMKRTLQMYLICGISTAFWGVMFGGYFGDAIQVISSTFFNRSVMVKPLWFSPMEEPMRMLMFSLLVGIIHLFAGLGMKLYSYIKAGNLKAAVYDVVFWYMLVGGGIVLLLTTKMFTDMAGLDFILPRYAGNLAIAFMTVGATGIILTSGRSSKNPFKRIAKGVYGLYNVTGYLSDILSYSRLLALGLATGVIANVFNKMGSMFGGGFFGAIAFALVFIMGHTLNIGINLLGAYVHTNRLQFVEFFGKFYEGGGEKFSPFRTNTGYLEINKK